MLADVIGLLLAFFVLSFSMRDFVPIDPTPVPAQREAIAVLEAAATDQLRELEQERASAPSFAYLAAIMETNSRHPLTNAIWHDDTRLVLQLPGKLDTSRDPADVASRETLLALAFLARRFDLDLALRARREPGATLEDSLVRAATIRAWLGETTGLTLNEMSFARPATAGGGAKPTAAYVAALNARPAQVPVQVPAPAAIIP